MRCLLTKILCLLFIFISLAPEAMCDEDKQQFVLVIDPGHGGKDSGCVGDITKEKSIVLDVASRLGRLVAERCPEVKIVFTRDDDSFPSLQQRANIANQANGSVFISIHVNSVDKRNRNRRNIHGASVYTLGLRKSDNNLSVAMRENSVMELEDDYSEKYQGFDPNSSESYIIFELNQNVHMQKSIELANIIQNELVTTAQRADKGVRQDGFWVLWATSMPSVLVELDYICNAEAERFMASDEGKDKLALAICNAFESYYTTHRDENHGPRIGRQIPVDSSDVAASESKTSASKSKSKAKSKSKGLTYHVQLLSARKIIPKNDSEIKGIKDLDYFRDGKYYKYYCGNFKTLDEAKRHLKKMRKRFPKAFVIKMRDGKLL